MKKIYLFFALFLILNTSILLSESSVSQKHSNKLLIEQLSWKEEAASHEPKSLAVKELYNEFKVDISAVSKKYRNKSIISTGVVVKKGPDMHGTPSVELSDIPNGKPYAIYVVNSFNQLDEIKIGETITMQGIFHIFGSDDWVVMKQGIVVLTQN